MLSQHFRIEFNRESVLKNVTKIQKKSLSMYLDIDQKSWLCSQLRRFIATLSLHHLLRLLRTSSATDEQACRDCQCRR